MNANSPAKEADAHRGKETRIASLDGIRGIAILAVLLFHFFLPANQGMISALFRRVIGYGWLGVDLFFVLSGFLITGILIRTRNDPHYFRNFYIRRVLRIFPAYYLVLTLLLFVYPFFNASLRESGLTQEAPWLYLHLQNWLWIFNESHWYGVLHFWSLAVEEQFYLFWPLLIFLIPPHLLSNVCIFAAAFSITIKLTIWGADADHRLMYLSTLSRLDAFAAGAWVANRIHEKSDFQLSAWMKLAILGAASALFLLVCLKSGTYYSVATRSVPIIFVATTATPILFAAWIWYVVTHQSGRLATALSTPFLRFFGKYSYGIYLIHLVLHPQIFPSISAMLTSHGINNPNLHVLIIGSLLSTATVILALIMYRFIEEPCLNLRHSLGTRH